ncbi:hypothetical protein KIN20_031968 [Parelaphostrongylus tenuis]|uniref:Uncharacterized protein n=1 Tax=Parelaphostrongylus tenuis TaxID=148309 RepID=A0AAD5R699_PARTN|nr:hypothetical protein KIN20_031968 [Parelaphostrongylus tenuis]
MAPGHNALPACGLNFSTLTPGHRIISTFATLNGHLTNLISRQIIADACDTLVKEQLTFSSRHSVVTKVYKK